MRRRGGCSQSNHLVKCLRRKPPKILYVSTASTCWIAAVSAAFILTPKGLHFYNRRAARRRSQSALPRETYYIRSRWSLEYSWQGLTRLGRRGGFAARRLKSTVIEMSSLRDAILYSSFLFLQPIIYRTPFSPKAVPSPCNSPH